MVRSSSRRGGLWHGMYKQQTLYEGTQRGIGVRHRRRTFLCAAGRNSIQSLRHALLTHSRNMTIRQFFNYPLAQALHQRPTHDPPFPVLSLRRLPFRVSFELDHLGEGATIGWKAVAAHCVLQAALLAMCLSPSLSFLPMAAPLLLRNTTVHHTDLASLFFDLQ